MSDYLHTDKNNRMTMWIIVMLFLVDFVTFFSHLLPISILKLGLYFSVFVLMIIDSGKEMRSAGINDHFWKVSTFYSILLFIRIVYDFVLPGEGFFLFESPYTILFFFFSTIVMPLFFFRRIKVNINVESFILIATLLILLTLSYAFMTNMNSLMATSGEYMRFSAGELDIIEYGHFGCSGALIALYSLIFIKNRRLKILGIVLLIVSLTALILSGSRSPFVALIVGYVVLHYSKTRKIKGFVMAFIIIVASVFLFEDYLREFNDYLVSHDIHSFGRVISSLYGGLSSLVEEDRNILFSRGWNMFLDSPLLGSGLLLPEKMYVHNIFVEQFMATGILGGLLFIIMNYIAIKKLFRLIRISPMYSVFAVLFIQYLLYGCFSRTIIAIGPYWLFMVLVVNLCDEKELNYGYSNNSNI